MEFAQCGPGAASGSLDGEAMTGVLNGGVVVCRADEWDDQVLDGGEELVCALVLLQCFLLLVLLLWDIMSRGTHVLRLVRSVEGCFGGTIRGTVGGTVGTVRIRVVNPHDSKCIQC